MTRQEKIEKILKMIQSEGGYGVKIGKDKITYYEGLMKITLFYKFWGVRDDKEE